MEKDPGLEVENSAAESGRTFLNKSWETSKKFLQSYLTLPETGDKPMHFLARTVSPLFLAGLTKLAFFPTEGSIVHADPKLAYATLGSFALLAATNLAHSLERSYRELQERGDDGSS